MNKFTKIFTCGTAAAMMALCFAGCGANSGSSSSSSSAASSTTTTAAADYNLVTKGKLTMGTNAEFPPFEYMEGGQVVGVDASIMAKVAEKLGLTLEIKNMEFDSLPTALSSNQIDVIAAGFTVKPEREETMAFSDSYYTAKQTVIVKSGSSYKSKDDLKDKKIGVQTGTTGSFSAEDLTDKANIIGYSNGSLAVEALLNGNVEAVIIDNNPAKEYKSQHSDSLTLIEDQFDPEDYAMAVKKGNTALQQAINNALKELKADGTLQKIQDEFLK